MQKGKCNTTDLTEKVNEKKRREKEKIKPVKFSVLN